MAVGIGLPIGVLTAVKVHDSLPVMTGDANTSTEAVFSNTFAGFGLGAISPIVIAASVIISIVIGAFTYTSRSTGSFYPLKMFEKLEKFLKNRRAITGSVFMLVVSLITIAVVLPVSVLTISKFASAIPNVGVLSSPGWGLGVTANTTSASVFTNMFAGFNLFSISPIVIAASLIISIVVGAFVMRRRQ